jgi:septal ring-binding cell division protein DamX
MAHDVFISYSTEDRQVADKVCAALEAGGIKCWIAPRDVPYGADYEESIVDAITSSRLLVLVLSSHSNASPHVKREIQNACAGEAGKPVIPLRIEEIEYNKALRYYLHSAQWLDAATPPLEQHLGRLVEHVRSSLSRAGEAAHPERPATAADARTAAAVVAAETPARTPDAPRTADAAQAAADSRTGRKPPLALLVAAGLGALALIVIIAFFTFSESAENTNTLPQNAFNANAVAASPTPQRTPTPAPTPKASATPTPRVVFPSRNLNLRRIPNR